ncbi:MAG: Hsp20/alpha crystallin family protein, partial [Rubrivivax sp.]
PGVSREALNLRVDGDQLHIEAQMALPTPSGLKASHAEVHLARYERTFTLSKELDAEQISGELKHGVLKVRIPKTHNAQPRRIAVEVH